MLPVIATGALGMVLIDDIKEQIDKIAKQNHADEHDAAERGDWETNYIEEYYKKVEAYLTSIGATNIEWISKDYYENIEEELTEYACVRTKPTFMIEDPYHNYAGWTNSGWILFEHPKQPKHPDEIEYPGGFKQLATDLGNLSYDALGKFLALLTKKLEKDAKADKGRKRLQLAKELTSSANHIKNAWKICKPYMT